METTLISRTAEGQDTILARRREQTDVGQLSGTKLCLPDGENKTRARRVQETADHVLCTHSHTVVSHDDVYQSEYTFSLRLAPQMSCIH